MGKAAHRPLEFIQHILIFMSGTALRECSKECFGEHDVGRALSQTFFLFMGGCQVTRVHSKIERCLAKKWKPVLSRVEDKSYGKCSHSPFLGSVEWHK